MVAKLLHEDLYIFYSWWPMTESRPDLIYDIGLFDGEDTAYYLFRGYNVVAVDANPLMVERARSRFSKEIAAKRLTLVNAGISETEGTATFWVSDSPEWSSFDKSIASRGKAHWPVPVPTVPFLQLLAEHGMPNYLKIDIEGNDRVCVDALRGRELPRYISMEAECFVDGRVVSDLQATANLELLREIGYRRFKLVNQNGWIPVGPNRAAYFVRHLFQSAARGRLRVRGLSRIAYRFTVPGRIAAASGFVLNPGSSGPWGDEISGDWMSFEKAKSVYLQARQLHYRRRVSPFSFWHDWHATYL
jgi:FkbM family methyltransferase